MGYLSDVAISLRKADYEKMVLSIKEKGYDEKVVNDITKFIEFAKEDGEAKCKDEEYICLYWENEKWCDHFEEVKFINEFLEDLKEYDLLKLGTDGDDITMILKCEKQLFGLARSIDFYKG